RKIHRTNAAGGSRRRDRDYETAHARRTESALQSAGKAFGRIKKIARNVHRATVNEETKRRLVMQIIRAKDRYHLESGWLLAYWLFSVDRYYDPNNIRFGPLRVFNHDTIEPGAGFPTHPHREMEIITYVLEGRLRHKDSTGGEGVIRAGEVQRMTAGTGVAHSEFNGSETEQVKLLQMWVVPDKLGLLPSYEQKQFSLEQRTGKLLPIASGQDAPGTVNVHQDVRF